MILQHRLQKLVERFEAIQSEMNANVPRERFVALSKEFSELSPVVAAVKRLQAAQAARDEARLLLEDKEMAAMAREELDRLDGELPALERDMQLMLLPKDAADERNVILEVRAGTGGDEASLFAGDLFRMYSRFAERRGWRVEIVSLSPSDLGGYKEVIAKIDGAGAYSRLKFESGGHRVQVRRGAERWTTTTLVAGETLTLMPGVSFEVDALYAVAEQIA